MTARERQSEMTVIENLIAISLLAIASAGALPFILYSTSANHSTRSHAAVVAQAQQIIDNYRSSSYDQLLARFGADFTAISDGQTADE
jgi:type II secretory pathway pseudopilin PulG